MSDGTRFVLQGFDSERKPVYARDLVVGAVFMIEGAVYIKVAHSEVGEPGCVGAICISPPNDRPPYPYIVLKAGAVIDYLYPSVQLVLGAPDADG